MKKVVINKKDLLNNLNLVKKELTKVDDNGNKVKLIAVVKANGMGLGLVEYSKFLVKNKVDILAVATSEEAIALRKNEIDAPILMLSPVVLKEEIKELIENDIILTVGSIEEINLIKEVTNKKVKVHVKIDSGFCRYGFLYSEKEQILEALKNMENLEICGMYTHFSKAIDRNWTQTQFDRFLDVVAYVKKNGIEPQLLHCCNSTAFLLYRHMHLNAVRLGSVLQGRILVDRREYKKIGTFKTNITEIKEIPKGTTVSYGNNFKVKHNTKIAIIPVGYVDGLNHKKARDSFKLSENIISVLMELKKVFKDNSIKVKINDIEYNVIGRLGMYHAIVDITGEEFKIGDEVVINIPPLTVNSNIRREYI